MKEFTITITSLADGGVELIISKPTEESPEPTLGETLELTMTAALNVLRMMDEATNSTQTGEISDMFNIMASNILEHISPTPTPTPTPTIEQVIELANDKSKQSQT